MRRFQPRSRKFLIGARKTFARCWACAPPPITTPPGSDAIADVGPQVREAMKTHPEFNDIGKRMLTAWAEGARGQVSDNP